MKTNKDKVHYQSSQEKENLRAYREETSRILLGARTGLWTIEVEEGKESRLICDETMCMLVGVPYGTPPEECYSFWISHVDPDYIKAANECVADIVKTGRAEVTYPYDHPTQGRLHIRCGGVLVDGSDLQNFVTSGYHQDITETTVTMLAMEERQKARERAYREELEKKAKEATRANMAKSAFLSRMSHDIRTPINGIIGMLDIADKYHDDVEKLDECLAKIRTASNHLLSLVNDVLDMSRLESGRVVLEEVPFDLREVFGDCYEIITPLAEGNGITVEADDLSGLTYPYLIGSPLHLRQIFVNIITNAIKYNKPNGRVKIIYREEKLDTDHVAYTASVEDTGIGMQEEYLEHIFEPFSQENPGAGTTYEGTGLGLAIVHEIVSLMGGTISVQSKFGEGSRFDIYIPFRIDHEQHAISQEPEQETADIAGKKILLVEDNDLNLEIAQFMLGNAGAVIDTATNGKLALEQFRASAPGDYDLILMDVMMPEMDGLQAAREIRALKRSDAKTIPIIAMTANAFAEDAQKCREAGMNDHIAKPLDMKKALHTMAKYL